jgi:hypothetical protein
MMAPLRRRLAGVVIVQLLASPPPTAVADNVLVGEDPYKVAQRLAAAAAMREGDLVLVSGSARDAPLLDRVAAHVRSAGARPVLTLDGGQAQRPLLAPRQLLRPPDSGARRANAVSAQIIVEFGERPAAVVDASTRTFYSRSVRQVYLENDLYPTKNSAEVHGVLEADLAKKLWEAVALDRSPLPFSASALRSTLVQGKELRVRHANGTDLTLRVEGRPVFASDGAVSLQDAGSGRVARSVWLPAGEVYLTPLSGSAEGTVVVERQVFQGRDILGLELHYKAGRLASMSARSGLEPLKALYDSAGPGRDVLGVIDIGINPTVRGSGFIHSAPAGMVTLYLGNNQWAGGSNATSFGLGSLLLGTTVTLDGRPIVEDGALTGAR